MSPSPLRTPAGKPAAAQFPKPDVLAFAFVCLLFSKSRKVGKINKKFAYSLCGDTPATLSTRYQLAIWLSLSVFASLFHFFISIITIGLTRHRNYHTVILALVVVIVIIQFTWVLN